MIKKLTKEQAIKLIKENSIEVWYDDKWKYWNTGDDYRTCPLLHLVHSIEQKGSYVIIIRDAQVQHKDKE